ncbi:Protein SHQ1 [Candida viswanathii]|uniref:Protein SHQ1 n=1 Tax=Candida viswanathii TaxID=5486 RepID=A0A367XR27_9ASCO|nr:Protein SHQ1 [Candida viswanathii]
MITPFFTIAQDDEFIYIDVKISHIRFSAPNIEMTINNDVFVFSLPPYYLRLRLPYNCVEDERSHAEYDSKSECVKIKIPKENKGQFFPDLDLTAKLLARTNEPKLGDVGQQDKSAKPLIEEVGGDVGDNHDISQAEKDLEEGEQFNWEVKQEVPVNPALEKLGDDGEASFSNVAIQPTKYGFNNQYDQIVGVSMANGNDINELGNPENTPDTDRIIERLIKENIKFDPEIYAADYIMEKYPAMDDDKDFKSLIEWKNPMIQKFLKWYKQEQSLPGSERSAVMPVDFTKEEQEKMIHLPRKSYLIEDSYKPEILILLVCLLFAYHFDLRENEGDHNIESAWTIGKITPQFAFLDAKIVMDRSQNNALRAAVITCVRRALSYPFHRSFKLIGKVWDDVYYNLRGGKRLVLKALLGLKELFRFHDIYYVYDKIWLEDLCSYLISDNISEATIRNLAHDLKKEVSGVTKQDITFEKMNVDAMKDEAEEGQQTEDDDDEMIALNLEEIEMMAEDLYKQYQDAQ